MANYVNVPKDILKIREKYLFGLTKRQLLFVLIAGILCYIGYGFLKEYLGTDSLYISGFLAIVVLFIGFFEEDGLFLEHKIKNLIYFVKNKKVKLYKTENIYQKILIDEEIRKIAKG